MQDIIKGLQEAARKGEEGGRRDQVKKILLGLKYGKTITQEDVDAVRSWLATSPPEDDLLQNVQNNFNL